MKPDVLVWGALLSSLRLHGNIETCEIALKRVIELDPTNSGAFVLLSNVYAKMGRWVDLRHVRNVMEARGIKKVPGCCLVEVEGVLHDFLLEDDSHPETREIYKMLDEIMSRLDEEGRVSALSLHSKKMAIAFCFLKTSRYPNSNRQEPEGM